MAPDSGGTIRWRNRILLGACASSFQAMRKSCYRPAPTAPPDCHKDRTMHRSTRRILTTHTGSLPRPPDLVAMLNAKELGEPYDAKAFAARVERAISEVVQQQVDTGLDVIGDGEHSKFNWMAYARARLTGLEE